MIPADVHYWAAWATLRSAFKWFIILFFLFYTQVGFTQDSASLKPVNFKNQTVSKKKVRLLTLASIGAYAGTTAALYHTWYKKYPQTHFHTFNDWDEWMQMDKVGHVLSAYSISKVNMELWRWTGVDRKKRIWIGGMSGAVYQTVIETLDGFSSEWGWSWGDFGANMLGSSAFVAQELAWDEQRIQLKLSSHRKRYADASLNQRSNEIFGKSLPERLLKDYNAYTYWISVTPKSFFPKSNLPPWLQLSLGIGAEGMFGARSNIARDKQGNIIYDRSDIQRYRQWYLAPDIDLTKIKTNKKGIRILLNALNVIKFPAPALEYSRGSFKMRWLVF